MKTKYEGLWYDEEKKLYKSKSFSNKKILELINKERAWTRFVVFKNKYHKKGDNRPEFVLTFQDNSTFDKELNEEEENIGNEYILLEDAINIMQSAVRSAEYGNSDAGFEYSQDMRQLSVYAEPIN